MTESNAISVTQVVSDDAQILQLQALAGGLEAENRNLHRVIEGVMLERDALREAAKLAREALSDALARGTLDRTDHKAGILALAALDAALKETPYE